MGIKSFKPYTPSRRKMTVLDNKEIEEDFDSQKQVFLEGLNREFLKKKIMTGIKYQILQK